MLLTLASSYYFYGRMQQAWADFPQACLPMLLIAWLLQQVFVLRLMLDLERPRVRDALRLSAFIYLRLPECCFALAVLLAAPACSAPCWRGPRCYLPPACAPF